MTPKVRFVKCPKCLNLLAEPEDVSIYRCGGCDTILQVKSRNMGNAENTRSDLPEATDAPKVESAKGLEELKESYKLDKESFDLECVKQPNMSENSDTRQDNGTHDDSSNRVELAEEVNRTRAESRKEANHGESNEEHKMNFVRKRMISEETFASTEYLDPRSEFSGPVVGDSLGSPITIRGHRFHHGYDGSISSLDEPHDWQKKHSGKEKEQPRKEKEKFDVSIERLRKNQFVSDEKKYGRNSIELPPRAPVHKRVPRFKYEDEGPSDQTRINGFFPLSPRYRASRSPGQEFIKDEDTMRLLEIVYELEDELKKACNLNGLAERRPIDLSTKKGNPWGEKYSRFPRIPFSAETLRNSREQRSEPLPPPRGTNVSYGNYNSSWPSSPQHFQPIARAVPFTTCYHCSAILQIPEDSFGFRKRFHRMKCGSCSAELALPYEHDIARAPPPSEAEDYDRGSVDARNSYSAYDNGEIRRIFPEGRRDLRASPIHEIMGYSSASRVYRGFGNSASGAASSTRKMHK